MDLIEHATKLAHAAGGGYLPAPDVVSLVAMAGSVERLMLDLIPLARRFAIPRLSGFQVGAVAQGESGCLYFGANFEFESVPLSQTIHAEQAAVINAASHGEKGLRGLAVSAAPCGHCRQFLFELSSSQHLRLLLEGKNPLTLADLLPHAFGPADLGLDGGLLAHGIKDLKGLPGDADDLTQAAFDAARASYAPYTGAHSGAALRTREGRIVAGSYLENAAFNPSVSPLQAALVNLALAGGEMESVVEAALVQVEGSRVDHEAISRSLLDGLAPGARLACFCVGF